MCHSSAPRRFGFLCWFTATAWVFVVPCLLISDETPKARRIEASGNLELKPENKCFLKITVTNKSDVEIKIHAFRFPWNDTTGTIRLFGSSSRTEIKQFGIPQFPDLRTITLKPGESVSGQINLSDGFAVKEIKEPEEIDVFWAFDLETASHEVTNRVGGWVSMPKTKAP